MAQPLCIYMDVSALCRPFDDQSQLRIRFETDAVLLILGQVQSRKIALIVSPVHDVEIGAMDVSAEREQVLTLLRMIAARFNFDLSAARVRAEALV